MSLEGPRPPDDTFAGRLNHLIETRMPSGVGYSDRWLARAVGEVAGADPSADEGDAISPNYVAKLRRGISTNPTVKVARWIAKVFGVPVRYLVEDPEDADSAEAMLADLLARGEIVGGARGLLFRNDGTLSPADRLAVEMVHARLREAAAEARAARQRAGA